MPIAAIPSKPFHTHLSEVPAALDLVVEYFDVEEFLSKIDVISLGSAASVSSTNEVGISVIQAIANHPNTRQFLQNLYRYFLEYYSVSTSDRNPRRAPFETPILMVIACGRSVREADLQRLIDYYSEVKNFCRINREYFRCCVERGGLIYADGSIDQSMETSMLDTVRVMGTVPIKAALAKLLSIDGVRGLSKISEEA